MKGRESFIIKVGMLSGPVDFLLFNCDISFPTSCTVKSGIVKGGALLRLERQCCLRLSGH